MSTEKTFPAGLIVGVVAGLLLSSLICGGDAKLWLAIGLGLLGGLILRNNRQKLIADLDQLSPAQLTERRKKIQLNTLVIWVCFLAFAAVIAIITFYL